MIWILIVGVVWMCLVAAVVFLALSRTSLATYDRRLPAHPRTGPARHFHLRRIIQSEDRAGMALTVAAVICSLLLAILLAQEILRHVIHHFTRMVSPL